MDILLEEIVVREKNAKAKNKLQDWDKNKKAEKEKATVEVRKQAMERMSDTKKRENSYDESGIANGKKKVRFEAQTMQLII